MTDRGSSGRSTRGRFLVSVPDTGDPNFDQGVVLMLDHTPDGALGLVINRVSGLDVLDLIGAPVDQLAEPKEIFFGGPVSAGAVMALGMRRPGAAGEHMVALFGPVVLVDVEELTERGPVEVDSVRFYNGYSGWSGGQLETELASGMWHVVDATPDDIFTGDPDHLWRTVMRRQGGRLAAQGLFPDDVSVN